MSVRRTALALFACSALIYSLCAPGHLGTVDMRAEFSVAQSIVDAGNFTVNPTLPYVTVPSITGPDGAKYSDHGVGQSLLLLPAALIGRVAGCDENGCQPIAQHDAEFAASFVDAAAAAVAVMIMFLLALELGASIRAALALALIYAFGTVTLAYAHDAFDVGPTGTALLLTLYALQRGLRTSSAGWMAAGGAALGFAVLLRLPTLVLVPIFAAFLVIGLRRSGLHRLLRCAVAFALPLGALLLFLAWYNWARLGDPLESGYGLASDVTGFDPSGLPGGVAGLLFSPGRSVLLYSPIVIVALCGLLRFWRAHRALATTVIALVLANLAFYGSYPLWEGGWGWGPRYLAPVTGLLLLPLLPFLQRWSRLRIAWRLAIGVSVFAGIVLSLLDVAVDFQHQTQLLVEQGITPPDQHPWLIDASGFWLHAHAVSGLITGTAAYPVTFTFTDLAAFMPLHTVLDTWWMYAWINGVSPAVIITALLVAAGGIGWSAVRLWRVAVSAGSQDRLVPVVQA